jgi:sugar lactone lactonase YvrE
MRKLLLSLLPLAFLAALPRPAAAAEYKAVANWYHLAEGRPQMGNMHGDIAVASNGDVYVSTMDPKAALQVYAADGKFIRNVTGAPPDFHGFVIHKDADGEFIYGPRLGAGNILKLTLDGKVVLDIPPTAIPDEFKSKVPKMVKGPDGKEIPNPNAGKPVVRLTAMDVAPNGDLYVTDGYSSDYVHQFDKTGKYIRSFGGKKEPYGFKTLHKIAIDTRFSPPRIIGTDRANGRVVHMSLDGEFLGVVAKDLLLPAAVAIHGDLAVIGELKGRVTLLDKAGKVVVQFGMNDHPEETGSNKAEPDKWRTGVVTAPHGVAFDAKGDVFVAEYNIFGRVHRFNRE